MYIPWDGMGYSKKNLIPWDGTIYKTFRPIPSHGTKFFKKRPMGWDGMGWDGMGWDCPIPRGALIYTLISKVEIVSESF